MSHSKSRILFNDYCLTQPVCRARAARKPEFPVLKDCACNPYHSQKKEMDPVLSSF